MSTDNKCFYGELTKIILLLLSSVHLNLFGKGQNNQSKGIIDVCKE